MGVRRGKRRTITSVVLACLTVATGVMVGMPNAQASTRGDVWRAKAITAINSFAANDDGLQEAGSYAFIAEAIGRVYGWDDSRITTYLNKIYSLQNPDGGFGIGEAWDAFSDGTTNPATTSYAVSMADHVGLFLLEGYKKGVIPRDKVQNIVNRVIALPRVTVSKGQCVSYSSSTNDAQTKYCTHNANAIVGSFLAQANDAGFSGTSIHKLITDISVYETYSYRSADVWWSYREGTTTLQDADHESATAQPVHTMVYWVGREATYKVMNTAYTDPLTALAHMRLVSSPGGPGSTGTDFGDPNTTLWCAMGDRWFSEADAFIANPPGDQLFRWGQAAVFAARNANACS